MRRITFDESKYEKDEYIKKAMELCRIYGGTLMIDIDFCVYAIYDDSEHWIGYANPYDMEWFDAQFKCDSGGSKCQIVQKYQQK